ncbi:hypothetical protein NHX12_027024 [Muraenolepis orangiensis]|uniref:SH2 domain containing 3Ca n=1 Tax=Muraenolepis orangiensis TaxID=630683 RepID=A0A9Q0EEQ0_9TELE|nr:hypothetical protein NHX12_027024 [Muraenolepis orangiensis]
MDGCFLVDVFSEKRKLLVSETLVQRSGDFLVRDSLTSGGDYVLTCRHDNEVLHFKISKVLVKATETKDLVRFYVAQRRPVSRPSGALICCPVSRTLPLRYLEATFALAHTHTKQGSAPSPSGQRGGAHIKRRSVTMTDVEAPPPEPEPRPCSPSTVHHHREAMRNCALSLDQIQEYHSPSRLAGETPRSPAYAAVTRHRTHSGGRVLAVVPPSPVLRRSSDPQLSPSADGGGPPPKPPAKGYVDRLQLEEGGGATEEGGGATEGGGARQGEGGFSAPQVETTYESSLLPPENKPLEMSVLKRVKELLAEVARILGVSCDMQRMMGVASGLEFYTMSIMVAVDLLGCTGTTEERAALLHKTILLAAELKTCLGNMFGFAAVMRALDLPQISRLEQTWVTLRQRHTEGAILYEKKLKPFMKNMNDCQENSVLSNTAFPHVVPVLSLLERCVPPGGGRGRALGERGGRGGRGHVPPRGGPPHRAPWSAVPHQR